MRGIVYVYGALVLIATLGCGEDSERNGDHAGGSGASDGGASGAGAEMGGSSTGGSVSDTGSGGVVSSGGTHTGGVGTSGTSAGGHAGENSGGAATGGSGDESPDGASAGTNGSESTGGTNLGGNGGASTGGSGGAATVVLPAANAPFDYQIGQPYAPPEGVAVVSRDRESAPAAGLYNICYVNGFQGQPNDESWWLDDHPGLVLRDRNGDPVMDEDWGELLLDTSTAEKRTELAAIVGAWIEQCAADGFDAVEIDNLDSYSRSDGLLDEDNNVALMALLSAIAHGAGLAIAQKNSVELVPRVAEMGTDFAIAEECNRWDECADYQDAYGDRVFVIEYRQQDFDAGCADFPELSIVLRDLDVTAPGSGTYVFDAC